MPRKDRWIAGLDLAPRSQGIVRFCRWLASRDPAERSVAVHVVDPGVLGYLGLRSENTIVLDRAADAIRAFIAAHGDPSSFERVSAVEGDFPSQTLEAARIFHHARGIIVGRNERSLGRVTRRLLAAPTGIVAVVPPSFEIPQTLSVVCCCSLDDAEGQVVQVAHQLATRFGAKLSLVHVLSGLEPAGALYMSSRVIEELTALQRDNAQRDLARLAARHELDGVERLVVKGSFVASVMAFAAQKGPCLVVCGTHRRRGLDKVRSASRTLELAQAASFPVLVVPGA